MLIGMKDTMLLQVQVTARSGEIVIVRHLIQDVPGQGSSQLARSRGLSGMPTSLQHR